MVIGATVTISIVSIITVTAEVQVMIMANISIIPVAPSAHIVFKNLSSPKTINADHYVAERLYKHRIVKNNIVALSEDGEDPKVSLPVHPNRVVPGLHVANAHVVIIRFK